MHINALLNCLYCTIYLCELMNECFGIDYLFCSAAYRTAFAQYFKVTVVSFAGSVLVRQRHAFADRHQPVHADRPRSAGALHADRLVRDEPVYAGRAGVAVLSVVKLFDYEVNQDSDEFEYPALRQFHGAKEGSYLAASRPRSCTINYALLSVLCSAVDVIIVVKLRRTLREKRAKQAEQLANIATTRKSCSKTPAGCCCCRPR